MEKSQLEKTRKMSELLDQQYSPSWFDRFSTWVDIVPLPNWLTYFLVSILLFAFGLIVQRIDGSGKISDWNPIYFVALSQIGFMFIIIHYLDDYAIRVLDEFKPALNSSGADMFPELKKKISTLPARRTLFYCLLFMLIGLVLVIGGIMGGERFGSTINVSVNAFGIFTGIVMLLLWFTNGLFFYHTVHQLKMVDYIYTHLAVVHPFHQRELFVFSGFSARTGVALVIITPLWIIFDPGPVSLVICIIFAIFGLTAFIYPLLGVHSVLASEKERLLDENGKELERTISGLMKVLKDKEQAKLDIFDQTLSTLEKARQQIDGISTWPWKTETFRRLITAIILPTLIWFIQYLLSHYVLS